MITEALLEMHFHPELVKLFSSFFGKKYLRLLKPSARKEKWLGFDQGWIQASVPMVDFFKELKDAISTSKTSINSLYLAYFFQFKAVQKLTRRSSLIPASYTTPYFRSPLSLEPNPNTGISQHETLLRLSRISNTQVSYACPMMFDIDDIYETPDLSKIQFVNVSSSPAGWSTNQKHHLMFQTENDPTPLWCSSPVEGEAFSLEQILEQGRLRLLTREELFKLLATINTVFSEITRESKKEKNSGRIENLYPDSFTILEFSDNGS